MKEMRLSEFLAHLLSAHAQTLQRLMTFFSEEALLELLELAGESGKLQTPEVNPKWFNQPNPFQSSPHPYSEIENVTREVRLPPVLEFHLWAYPHYRAFIESSIDLNSCINNDLLDKVVTQAQEQARIWIRSLPLASELHKQAEKIASLPWLKFRTSVLKKAGRRPLEAVP